MAVISQIGNNYFAFYCPGCKESHVFDSTVWQFNGDMEKPTISPSYLTWLEPNPNADPKHDPKGKFRAGFRCHSFVSNGMIQFLGDCTHTLANQTVPLGDFP